MMPHQETSTAVLLNFVAPYHIAFLKRLRQAVGRLTIFVSTPMEPNRPWEPDWTGLDVRLQRSLTIEDTWRHPAGFEDRLFVHLPYDTILRLWHGKFDVVLSAEMGARSIQAAVYRMVQPRIRLLLWLGLSEHTEQGRGALRALARRFVLRLADGVVVNGKSGASYLRRLGVPAGRIYEVPYSVETSALEEIPLERPDRASERRLLFVGQLNQRKGIVPFLRALADWARVHGDENIELLIVGDGPLRDLVVGLPRPRNLRLELTGSAPYSEISDFYRRAGVLVFPTLADEWGVVVNEALAAGLPVLGSAYSQAVVELVESGQTGWVFRPDDTQSLRRALDALFSTTDNELSRMRARCRQKANDVSPDVACARMLEAIRGSSTGRV